MRRTTLCLVLLAGLAGCASDPEHGPGRGHRADSPGRGGERRGPNLNIFISPMGEPVRGNLKEPYASAQWFARVNSAHDGRLTEAEFMADALAFFEALDSNHDGVIDGFEVEDYERAIAPEIQPRIGSLRPGEGMDASLGSHGGGRGNGAPQGGPISNKAAQASDIIRQGAGAYSWLPDPEPVSSASAQLNDRITRDEWRAAAHRRFQKLDLAHHGYLSLSDLPKTPVQQMFEQAQKEREKEEKARAGHPAAEPQGPKGP